MEQDTLGTAGVRHVGYGLEWAVACVQWAGVGILCVEMGIEPNPNRTMIVIEPEQN